MVYFTLKKIVKMVQTRHQHKDNIKPKKYVQKRRNKRVLNNFDSLTHLLSINSSR